MKSASDGELVGTFIYGTIHRKKELIRKKNEENFIQ